MKTQKNPFKAGDKVYFKNDKHKFLYVVYAIYSPVLLTLGQKEFPDREQEFCINIKHICKKK